MAFKGPFEVPSPQVLASYDYEDIATGEAILTYYAATAKETTNDTYILTGDSSIYSNEVDLDVTLTQDSAAFTKQSDLDYDLSSFKFKQTFEGEGFINVYWGLVDSSADANGLYLIFKVVKWDGTTETPVASAQTETLTDDSAAILIVSNVPITIPKTNFAPGEVLRLTVEMWGAQTSAISNLHGKYWRDPINRAGTAAAPHFLKLNMPMKIRL